MGLAGGVLQRVGIRPSERALFGWASLCLVLTGAASFALLNAAEAVFLKRVGVESLPWVLLASAGALVGTTAGIGRVARGDPTRWLVRVLLGLALVPLPFVFVAESRMPLILGGFVLASRQILALSVLVFWLAMGSLVPARRAKQLFAPIAAGVTVGAMLGSFGSQPVAQLIGVEGLLVSCAGLLALAAFAARQLRSQGSRQLARVLRPAARAMSEASLFSLLRGNRLFRLLAIALLAGGVLSPVLFYEFSGVLDAATHGPNGEERLMWLLSQFRGWLNVAMLVSQLWLSAALYRRFGLPLSVATWPAAYLLGFAWLGIDFSLLAAFGALGTAWVAEDGISDSATRVLYNLFPTEVRAQATGLLEGPINRLGAALGSGLVLAAIALGVSDRLGPPSVLLASLWLGSALVLWRAYPGLLLSAAAEHGITGAGVDRATLLDAATLRGLASSLVDPDPSICRAAIDLVVDAKPQLAVQALSVAVGDAPEATRPMIVGALQRLVEPLPYGSATSASATDALAGALRARPPLPAEERGDLLQVYARLTAGEGVGRGLEDESRSLLDRALGDRAAPVRLAAVAELHRRGAAPPGLPDLDRALAAALDASDALVRRAARKELRAILLSSAPDPQWTERLRVLANHLDGRADRAETAEALCEIARRHRDHTATVARDALRYADDRDARVAGALLAMAGHAGLSEEAPRFVGALGARDSERAEGAREALVALGSEAVVPLLVASELGTAARREALAVLQELDVDLATLEALFGRQLRIVQEQVLHRAALLDATGAQLSLLRRRLEECVAEGVGALLDLLAAIHQDTRIAELERRLRRSEAERDRDILVEALEALLDRTERDALVPLLESTDWSRRGEAASAALGRARPTAEETLQELQESGDPTVRSVARSLSLESEDAIGDLPPMPLEMELAVRLQQMPVFDRLSTPQLMAVAQLLQEQKAADGEGIYREGEEGIALYLILEGDVELRRGALVIDHVRAGSFFGELATLDGAPRAADAVAIGPVRLLRLDREDLLSLAEDAPALAIGLAQFLSLRVRRLEDRLSDAIGAESAST